MLINKEILDAGLMAMNHFAAAYPDAYSPELHNCIKYFEGLVSESPTQELLSLLSDYFKDDKKILGWLSSPNYAFGGETPLEVILKGRQHKLIKHVKTAIEENYRP